VSRPELLLIDLGSCFWAAWHSSAEDELSAARDRTLRQVRNLVGQRDRKLVAVCCDSPKSWRKQKHPSYKANRPEKDHVAVAELERVKERLRADGLLLWEATGFEADDVIATACKLADQSGMDVLVASADKDLLQLVSHARSVRIISTKTGKVMLEEDVREKLGVLPPLVRDWLALVGDTSDNVEGVPGVGQKRASEMLNAWGSIEGIFRAILDPKAVTPAIRKALNDSADAIVVARELVTLSTDAPIDFNQLNEERAVVPLTETDYMDHGDPEDDGRNEPIEEQREASASATTDPESLKQDNGAKDRLIAHGIQQAANLAVREHETISRPAASFEHALEPMSINGAFKFAQGIVNSRLYPHLPNAEAIWAVMIRGREMGLGAMISLDTITMIKGKPALSAHLIIARAKQHPECEYFQFIEGDDKSATWECKRKGNPKPTRLTYTIEQAQAAGLANEHNWVKRRTEMLRKSAGVQLSRIEFPEAAIGMYAEEELSND
jgi:5'-3' exonuclease